VSDPSPAPSHPRARRLGAVLITSLVALGGVVLVILFFQGRDDAQLDRTTGGGPGQALADGGRSVVADGVTRTDGERMDGDEVAEALELGNVVVLHGAPRPPAPLATLADRIAGPFEPALLRSGQAIVIARRTGIEGIVALAWRRTLVVTEPDDPALDDFVSHWLGRGARG
jgi:hypothetical protein